VPDDPEWSVRRQCELLDLSRSSYYYEPVVESPENLQLMRIIDEQFLKTPFFGRRQMTDWLRLQGHEVNPKRIRRLMQLMGLMAVFPGKKTTIPAPGHRVYPYLLRGVRIVRPNQVWSTDITYVPLRGGFLYLVAVLDWYSRCVLSWRLSNTMDTAFCLDALDEALTHFGPPEIFNTDQGSQFTSEAFTSRLLAAAIAISMDGRGRALDNVFIERLWRSVKYENIYLKDYATGTETYMGLNEYFTFYNQERPHQSLDGHTPHEVYRGDYTPPTLVN
jgi:putative transposase